VNLLRFSISNFERKNYHKMYPDIGEDSTEECFLRITNSLAKMS